MSEEDEERIIHEIRKKAFVPTGGVNKQQGPTAHSVSDNVKVIVRVRPFNQREIDLHEEANAKLSEWDRRPLRAVVEMTPHSTRFLDHTHDYAVKEEFKFDENLWSIPKEQQDSESPFATQQTVFEKIGKVTLQHAMDGFNTCIFAYGQTGSGKTHTMMGIENDKGLIPNFCESLFVTMQEKAKEPPLLGPIEVSSKVEARFLEIYNEHVKDLLWQLADPETKGQYDKDNLKVRHIPGQGPYVVGLTSIVVQSWEECQAIISSGMVNRVTAATKMNDTSSRSHAVFRLTVTQTTTIRPAKQWERPKVMDRVSNINLVDLAGSERLKKSGAVGQRLKEAAAINLSLTTLKNVIDALVEGRPVIPYRGSQLTWLLSESLGGNSKTFMIACISPHLDNADETLNTMRYALRTQGIINHARVNESDEARKLAALQKKLQDAQKAMLEGAEGQAISLRKKARERADALREARALEQQREEEAKMLQDKVASERKRTYETVYMNVFRDQLYNRIADRLHMLKKDHYQAIEEAKNELGKAKEDLSGVEQIVRQKLADEEQMRIALKRVEREHAKAQGVHNDTNETIKNMTGGMGDMTAAMNKAKVRLNLTTLYCFGRLNIMRAKQQKETDELAAAHAQALQQCSRQAQAEKSNLQMLHQRNIKVIQKEMEDMTAEVQRVTAEIQSINDDRKAQIRKLNEDITFFERENRNLDDERVQKLNDITRTQSQKYQNETARLSERSVKGRQIIEQRHISFMHEAARQIKTADAEHEKALGEVDDLWGSRLRRVQSETSAALNTLAQQYNVILKAHDAQIEDARNFVHNWSHGLTTYGSVYDDAQDFIGAHRSSGERDFVDIVSLLESTSTTLPTARPSQADKTTPRSVASGRRDGAATQSNASGQVGHTGSTASTSGVSGRNVRKGPSRQSGGAPRLGSRV